MKSCVLLAGLFAAGETVVLEPTPTRDHTERALETFGVRVERGDGRVSIAGGQRLEARELRVPGDISGAAFWAALAAGTPDGQITVARRRPESDPDRIARPAGARRRACRPATRTPPMRRAEPVGTLIVAVRRIFTSFEIAPDEVPGVIDEIPALAALAAMMPPGHAFTVRGARELRVKESDRIAALAAGFRAMGVRASRNSRTAFASRRDRCARRRSTPLAITALRWRSRSPPQAPQARSRSSAHPRSTSPIPASSRPCEQLTR